MKTDDWFAAVHDAAAWAEAARLVHEGYERTLGALLMETGFSVTEVAKLLGVEESINRHDFAPVDVDDRLWERVLLMHRWVSPEPMPF